MLLTRPGVCFVGGRAVEIIKRTPLPKRAKVWLVESKAAEDTERASSAC